MARLFTSGFEYGSYAVDGATATGTVDVTATGARLGGYCAQLGSGEYLQYAQTFTNLRNYYVRVYMKINTMAAGGTGLVAFGPSSTKDLRIVASSPSGSAADIEIRSTSGRIGPALTGAVPIGSWFRLEVRAKQNTTSGAVEEYEVRVDGTSLVSDTADFGSTAFTQVYVGDFYLASGTTDLLVDDIALNDDQGANQATWPGDAHVTVLLPTADSARGTNWTAGAGGTSNLWDALDNVPPSGLASASATNTSQIKNAAKDTSGVYDATLNQYSNVFGGGDTILLVQPIASIGNSSTTARSVGLQSASNPVIAETTASTSATTAAGTFPTGWSALVGTVAYGDIASRNTSAVLRVRKNSNVTDVVMACAMGLTVEYQPARPRPAPNPRRAGVEAAGDRAARW